VAKPTTVIPDLHSELLIADTNDGVEIAFLGPTALRWRHVVTEAQLLAAMERYYERRKSAKPGK
jgi:hypothetical protein